MWGQLLWLKPSTSGSPVAHEPPGSLVSGDGVDNPDRTATVRRHGQRPSISTSNEKLRNVLISTTSPKTATFSSDGCTATVLMMSAATKNSRPQQNAAPKHSPDDPVALVPTLAANQRQPSTDKGYRQATTSVKTPRTSTPVAMASIPSAKPIPSSLGRSTPGSLERNQRSTDLVWRHSPDP